MADTYINKGYDFVPYSDNIIKGSYVSPRQQERVIPKKGKTSRKDLSKRFWSFTMACLIAGGVASFGASQVIEQIQENALVYSYTSDFAKEVIDVNTHRTYDNQGYFRDYEAIAKHISVDEKDFSTELYKVYAQIGENETNEVIKFTDFEGSLDDYAVSAGYRDSDEWAKGERQKIVLQAEIDTRKSELDSMYADFNNNDSVGYNNAVGGK